MIKYDLYIRGNEPGLDAIKQFVTGIAERTGCITDDESRMNIPLGIVMQVLTGDALHLGLLIGMNTEDPYCVVLRIECEDIMPLHDALIECFGGIEIEMDEDVDDVPIIRKTKRFAFFERTARFFRTKRTSGGGYPPFQKFFDWLTPVLY